MELQKSLIDVRVEHGFLKLTGEIPLMSSKDELENFIAEIHFKILGSKKLPLDESKSPTFGLSSKLLNENEAAVYIGRSVNFLRKCRMPKWALSQAGVYKGPKYVRYSQRCIRYMISDLDEWIASHGKHVSN